MIRFIKNIDNLVKSTINRNIVYFAFPFLNYKSKY